jgi:hypothetical protein
MKLETFKKMIEHLKKDSFESQKLYELHIHPEIKDELNFVVSILIEEYFGEEATDVLYWWLYEEGDKKIYNKDKTVFRDLEKIEDLYEYICILSENKSKNSTTH